MTMLEQLAKPDSAGRNTPPIDLLPTSITEGGLLGNASAQVVHFSADVYNVIETYHKILQGAQPHFRLARLKRRTFTPETRRRRIDKSLAALNAAQPTTLTVEAWKSLVEELEDED
jgi:hypothetical protein